MNKEKEVREKEKYSLFKWKLCPMCSKSWYLPSLSRTWAPPHTCWACVLAGFSVNKLQKWAVYSLLNTSPVYFVIFSKPCVYIWHPIVLWCLKGLSIGHQEVSCENRCDLATCSSPYLECNILIFPGFQPNRALERIDGPPEGHGGYATVHARRWGFSVYFSVLF